MALFGSWLADSNLASKGYSENAVKGACFGMAVFYGISYMLWADVVNMRQSDQFCSHNKEVSKLEEMNDPLDKPYNDLSSLKVNP